MREAPLESDQPLAPVSSTPNDHASGWRAFLSVLLMGLCMSGSARPDPADFETRYHWQQMITAISACSFGALAAGAVVGVDPVGDGIGEGEGFGAGQSP